jgi:hypothetical protein
VNPSVPTEPSDYFIVVGLRQHPSEGVWGAAQVWIVNGNNEEEAVAKVAELDNEAERFACQVVPTFAPPSI